MTALTVAAVALTAGGALTACTSGGSQQPTSTPSATYLFPTPSTQQSKADQKLLKLVKTTACETLKGGGGVAEGTVQNTSDSDRVFDITVYFRTKKTDVYVSAVTTSVAARADSTAPWAASHAFASEDPFTCEVALVNIRE